MTYSGTPTWLDADEVKRSASRVGLDHLQQYLDHLTRTRAYEWLETKQLRAADRSRLAWLVGKEDLDYYEQSTTDLARWYVTPLRGGELNEYLSTADLTALVREMPFVRWYREERQRLRHDAQLLTSRAKQRENIAATAFERAETEHVAWVNRWRNFINRGTWSDREKDQARWSQLNRIVQLRAEATAERRAATWTSSRAARAESAADRLSEVTARELAIVGTSFESFICREFSKDLSPVNSVAMLFLRWVNADSIPCASPQCTQRFLLIAACRRRPPEYCKPACKMAAYRARQESTPIASPTP